MTGNVVIGWLIGGLIAICVFFLAQWLIPMIFGLVGFDIPAHIVNILALLIAIGAFYGWWRRG